MKSHERIIKLADRLQYKYADQPTIVASKGTTELFFAKGDEDAANTQRAFASAIQVPDPKKNPVYKILYDYFMKHQTTCSFNLKATADPKVGASWILSVEPTTLKPSIWNALSTIYQGFLGESMMSKQTKANAEAKAGSGSGTNDIGELELTP